jgi:hypothetical protein
MGFGSFGWLAGNLTISWPYADTTARHSAADALIKTESSRINPPQRDSL